MQTVVSWLSSILSTNTSRIYRINLEDYNFKHYIFSHFVISRVGISVTLSALYHKIS